MGLWIVLVLELRYQTDIFLYVFSLFLHSSHIVAAFLLPYPPQHLLILLDYSEQLFFSKRLMQSAVKTGHTFIFIFINY